MRPYLVGLSILFSVVSGAQTTEVQTELTAKGIYVMKDINMVVVDAPVMSMSQNIGYGLEIPFIRYDHVSFNSPMWICRKLGFKSVESYIEDTSSLKRYVTSVNYSANQTLDTAKVNFLQMTGDEEYNLLLKVHCRIN